MKNPCRLFNWLLTIAASLAAASATAAEVPKSTALFDRHFSAIGGRAAIEKIQSLVVKGTGQEGQMSFNFELSLKLPGLILFVARNGSGLEVSQGRDRQARCWRKYSEGVKDLSDQESGELMDLALAFHLPGQLGLARNLDQAVCEEEREGDRVLMAIGLKGGGGPFPRLLFDPKSGLLVRVSQVALDDYQEAEGVRLPFTVRPDAKTVLRVEKVLLNQPINNTIFERPESKAIEGRKEGPGTELEYRTMLSAAGKLDIVRRPAAANFRRDPLVELPRYNPKSSNPWQVDLRGTDLTRLDLSDRLTDLMHSDFDSVTRWPDKLPAGFDTKQIMEIGKDPGLQVRKLHARGLTGKGVGVGIIDQTLLVDHVEYRDRLRLYEEIHNSANTEAQMHGPAVASIAVGKTVGVAPESELYYIAETHGVFHPGQKFDWDFTWLAQSIERLLDVNKALPAERKMRVISISVGWSPNQKGYAEATAAVERAKKENVFVVSTSIESTYKLAFHGLGREAMADPNVFTSFGPGSWWASTFWGGQRRFPPGERLLVPMDGRTTASPTGPKDYVYYTSGGWSWSVPWIAGLYALACQVDPSITPERFWAEALRTGKTTRLRQESVEIEFGTLADAEALIGKLEANKTR